MARSCESFCCKKNKYCNVFVSTFTTTNQCEARLGGKYKLGKSGNAKELFKMRENTQTVGRAGRHVPSTRRGKNWDTCYK